LVLNGVRIQWGMVPNNSGYRLGDSVDWLRDGKGEIVPPFELREMGKRSRKWNCGEPQFQELILFDVLFDADVLTQNVRCPTCNLRIAAGIAVMNGGRFKEIRALTDEGVNSILGASRSRANIVIVRDGNTYWPREDWYDHPLKYSG